MTLNTIKDKFKEQQILARAKAYPFKHFFEAPSLWFFGVIIHHLLLRKTKLGNKNKIHFEISRRFIKFRIGEFTLITWLNFGPYPDKEVSHSTRLISTYLNDSNIVKSHELEAAFVACSDKDDAWKLDLVYFVDGVLYSHKSNLKVEMSLFSLVESEEDFFKYFFSREFFQRTLLRLDKDMVHLWSLYIKVVEKRKNKKAEETKYTPEAKYTIYSYMS